MVSNDGAFFGEAFDVGGFFFQIAERDEEREVGVLMSGVFEHLVERFLDVLPDGVAPGLDDHATAHGRDFGEVGGVHDLLVPLGVIFFAGGTDRVFGRLGHGQSQW